MADDRRGTAYQRGYNRRWQRARAVFLVEHPLCLYCERMGRITPATVVDHVIPHKGDRDLFWSPDNWQALCKPCHDSVKAREERSGEVFGCNVNGQPISPASHWNDCGVGRAGKKSKANGPKTERPPFLG